MQFLTRIQTGCSILDQRGAVNEAEVAISMVQAARRRQYSNTRRRGASQRMGAEVGAKLRFRQDCGIFLWLGRNMWLTTKYGHCIALQCKGLTKAHGPEGNR